MSVVACPPVASPRAHASLALTCLWFAAVGLAVAIAGGTGLFAPWRNAAAQALFGVAVLPATLEPFARLTFAILGGSIVGKWLAAYWLVRYPLARGRRWAWDALVLGVVGWFVVDSAFSWTVGAAFNVWMINAAPLGLAGIPLWIVGRPPRGTAPRPSPTRAWSCLFYVNVAFVGIGLMLVVAGDLPFGSVYTAQIAEVYFDGAMTTQASQWQRFMYGLVGAAFAAHFAMLAWAVRHAAGESWVQTAVAVSIVGWFVVDSTMSLVAGGAFNVLMINVPALLAIAAAWLWAGWNSLFP